MRIGLFAHRLSQTHPTGIGRYVRELVVALASEANDDENVVLASTPEPEAPRWVPRGIETRVLPWPRRPVHAAWCLGLGPRLELSLGSLDIAHLIQPFPPAPTKAPEIATVHDLFPFEHPGWYRRSERWSYRRSIDLVLRRARRIVVPSRYVAERVSASLGIDPSCVEVVRLGVSGAFAKVRSREEVVATCARFGVEPGSFVVCVGAVSTRKNVIALVRAAAERAAQSVPLVMVGPDGIGADAVSAEIARLDGKARVVRTGYLSDPETAALVQGAAVLVHPALGEGFGFVPLEAMAVGTPVIAGRVASIPEVVDDAAMLVDEPASPGAWAQALTDLMGSEQHRATLSAAGQRRAAEFSWQQTARAMIAIYRDVAAS